MSRMAWLEYALLSPYPSALPSLSKNELRVFFISIATVMGPTPPGTGVTREATWVVGGGWWAVVD